MARVEVNGIRYIPLSNHLSQSTDASDNAQPQPAKQARIANRCTYTHKDLYIASSPGHSQYSFLRATLKNWEWPGDEATFIHVA